MGRGTAREAGGGGAATSRYSPTVGVSGRHLPIAARQRGSALSIPFAQFVTIEVAMTQSSSLAYFRGRWPDDEIPDGEPEWVLYEISYEQDAVLRAVDIYPDGRITRNGVEIEERNGDHCPRS